MSWEQVGNGIYGDRSNGNSLSISADGSVVAIGGSNSARVYRAPESANADWTQVGQDLGDANAYPPVVSISASGEVVAVGNYFAPDDGGDLLGYIKVYRTPANPGGDWTQIGNTLTAKSAYFSAYVVCLSADGEVVALGDYESLPDGNLSGAVKIYRAPATPGGNWTQIGKDIVSDALEYSSYSASISTDGSIVAIGTSKAISVDSPGYTTYNSVYREPDAADGDWTQIGQTIVTNGLSTTISISGDGSVLALPSYAQGDSGVLGATRVYGAPENGGTTWTQIGQDILPSAGTSYDSQAVSLSSNGDVIAIGSFEPGTSTTGQVRLYRMPISGSTSWTPIGDAIVGETSESHFGYSVSLSTDGSTVAIGAPYGEFGGSDAGQVRVYQYDPDTTPPTLTLTIPADETLVVYKDQPVPTGKYVQSVSDNNTSPTAADVTLSSTGITSGVFTTPGVYEATWSVTDGDNTTTATRQVLVLNQAYQIPICFVASTPIQTDQGEIAINKLTPGVNTINGKCIVDITETMSTEETLVEIKANALSENVPSRDTVMTNKHKVYYNGRLIEAGSLVGKEGVTHIVYKGELVYNVVMSTYSTMMVNGMECETLDPENVQYKLMELHKRMLTGRCTEEMGVEFGRLMMEHKGMSV